MPIRRVASALFLLSLSGAFLSGCSSAPTIAHQDIGGITLEHEEGDFKKAMAEAAKHCSFQRKGVELKATSCTNKCVSSFACVSQ